MVDSLLQIRMLYSAHQNYLAAIEAHRTDEKKFNQWLLDKYGIRRHSIGWFSNPPVDIYEIVDEPKHTFFVLKYAV